MTHSTFDLVVFDLDGTLAETRADIARSLNESLVAHGHEPLPLATVVQYVGDGAAMLVHRALGERADETDQRSVLEGFLSCYRDLCLESSHLYDGVVPMLERLKRAGIARAVLTNKPQEPSERILSGLGVRHWFFRVVGGDVPPSRKPAPHHLLALAAECGTRPEKTLLVGDSAVDVATGRAAGVSVAGVAWGFRPDHFHEHPPDFLLTTVAEIAEIAIGGSPARRSDPTPSAVAPTEHELSDRNHDPSR